MFFVFLKRPNFKNSFLKGFVRLTAVVLSILVIVSFSACESGKTADTTSANEASGEIISSSDLKPELSSSKSESAMSVTSSNGETSSATEVSSQVSTSSKKEVSSKVSASSKKQTSSKKSDSSKKTTSKTSSAKKGYHYNTNLDIEDNVFMDSLIYTGYNMKKHRADGNMWIYILARYKRGLGYLSDITYGGGSTGLETKNGKPNIEKFEKGGLVCASFATYVYFNYLPNVAGIDTSALPRPNKTYAANDWYQAVKKWLKLGYSYSIPFTASKTSYNYIIFKPEQEIPIGSILIFQKEETRTDRGSHVAIYAGYKNGQHWVYHVGTENGPEMCTVERMLFGPVAQWPLLVVSTPTNIRMTAALEINLEDDNGKPIANAAFKLKDKQTGKITPLGKTDKKGTILKEGLKYTEYDVIQTVPKGYTCKTSKKAVELTSKNNSKNVITFKNVKDKPKPSSSKAQSSKKDKSSSDTKSSSKAINSESSKRVSTSSKTTTSK